MRLAAGLILLLILFLAGCADWSKKQSPVFVPVSPDAKYASQDLDALLLFSGELAKLPADQRLIKCNHILELNRPGQGLGLRLHLFVAQLLIEESCGDIRETSEILKARQSEIKDERVRHFLAFQDQMLARLQSETEQRKALDLNLKFSQQQASKRKRDLITFESEVKNCESDLVTCEGDLTTREGELKALQNKLDALKSIEQNLGGSQGH